LFATRVVRTGAAASEKTRGPDGREKMGVMGQGPWGKKITYPAHLCLKVYSRVQTSIV
jgi:hypothetical protein